MMQGERAVGVSEDKRLSRNPEVDRHLQSIVQAVASHVTNRYGAKGLRSMWLAGSAGRGEAVGILTGAPRGFTSDLDFVLAFNARGFLGLREDCRQLSTRLTEAIGKNVTQIELNPTSETLLRFAAPTIANLDLAIAGRVIYGTRSPLKGMRVVAIRQLDALELLFNRVSEFLEYVTCPNDAQRSLYLWSKFASDGIGAWLALKGHYAPSYKARLDELSVRIPELGRLLGERMTRILVDLLELRVDFNLASLVKFTEVWPRFSMHEVGVLILRIAEICLRQCNAEMDKMPESLWDLYRERIPLLVWTPYLLTRVPLMTPFLVRTGIHPKAVVNCCLLLLLSHMFSEEESSLSEAAKLLRLLGQEAEPDFGNLVMKARSLSRLLNGLPLKPYTPWITYL